MNFYEMCLQIEANNKDQEQLRRMGINPRNMTIGNAPQYDYADEEEHEPNDRTISQPRPAPEVMGMGTSTSHAPPEEYANYGPTGDKEDRVAQMVVDRRRTATPKLLLKLDKEVSRIEQESGDHMGRILLDELWNAYRSEFTDASHDYYRQQDDSNRFIQATNNNYDDPTQHGWTIHAHPPSQNHLNYINTHNQAMNKFGQGNANKTRDQGDDHTSWSALADWLEEHDVDASEMRLFIDRYINPAKGGQIRSNPSTGLAMPWRAKK